MPILKISLDEETVDRLTEDAVRDLRPIGLQAVAILRRSLGLPVPCSPAAVMEPYGEDDEANGRQA